MLPYSDQRHLPIINTEVFLMFHYSKTSIINVNSPDLHQDSTNMSTTQLCSAELSVPLTARLSSCLATAQHTYMPTMTNLSTVTTSHKHYKKITALPKFRRHLGTLGTKAVAVSSARIVTFIRNYTASHFTITDTPET
jgi:hypothetical protein